MLLRLLPSTRLTKSGPGRTTTNAGNIRNGGNSKTLFIPVHVNACNLALGANLCHDSTLPMRRCRFGPLACVHRANKISISTSFCCNSKKSTDVLLGCQGRTSTQSPNTSTSRTTNSCRWYVASSKEAAQICSSSPMALEIGTITSWSRQRGLSPLRHATTTQARHRGLAVASVELRIQLKAETYPLYLPCKRVGFWFSVFASSSASLNLRALKTRTNCNRKDSIFHSPSATSTADQHHLVPALGRNAENRIAQNVHRVVLLAPSPSCLQIRSGCFHSARPFRSPRNLPRNCSSHRVAINAL